MTRALSRAAPAPSSTATATSAAAPGRPQPGTRRRSPRHRAPVSVQGGPCSQPGCTGTIVDGYCDVCGSPAGAPRRGSARPATAGVPLTATATTAAARPPPGPRAPAGSTPPRSAPGGRWPAAARSPGGCSPARSGSGPRGSGAGLTRVPPAPVIDAVAGDHEEPAGAGGQARLSRTAALRSAGPGTAQPGRTEGFCPKCGTRVLLHPEAAARRPGRQPVRGGRLPGPRRARLDLPGQGPERLRPLGGAQGPAEHRRQGRAGGGDRRAAVPGPGRAPADRGDLQLRHPRGRRLHRDGVRRRHVAQADPEEPDAGQRRAVRPAAGGPGPGVHPRDPARLQLPARPRPGLLRLQARQPDPGRRRGQADRPRRRPPDRRPGVGDLRHRRLPGARRSPPSAPRSPPTSTRSAARWSC